jgi:ABC-2 type transport system ATP-binding protein
VGERDGVSEAPLAELRDVHKAFGERRVLAGASVTVERGEVVALLGRNGAGKTTAIRILLGLRRPDAGRARLGGRDPGDPAARLILGWAPQESDLPETLRVSEVIDLVRSHYPQPVPRSELAERFGVGDLLRRETGGLSGGQRRRVVVSLAFAGDPRLVVLDEPSSGLDRAARTALWQAIRSSAAAGRGILLATHDLAEAGALATRVVLLEHGRAAVDGTVDDMRRTRGGTRVAIQRQTLRPPVHADATVTSGDRLVFLTRTPGALIRELVEAEADLDELEVAPLSLEQALALDETG